MEESKVVGAAGRPPVMADVARVAGVSHQTVSRVLNGLQWVAAPTRQKVLDAVEQLGYRRNMAARALATNRSHVIGVVVVNPDLFGPSGALLGLEQAARQAGYWVSVASLPQVDAAHMIQAVDHFRAQGVDGTVVIAPNQLALDASAQALGRTPAVMVTAGAPVPRAFPSVDVDQELGARLAVKHLLAKGHVLIAHFAGPAGEFHAQCREHGWRRALADAGLRPGPLLRGTWTADSGYRLAKRLMGRSAAPPTAVFVANDQAAIGALRGFGEAGLRLPEDMSVVGFDDIPGASQLRPPLTTVRQDLAELGRRSFALLLDVISGHAPGAHVALAPELVVRASTAARARQRPGRP
ncbi:MAG: LacI family transcriptional regulator [Bifidobacteriaceae bacterium]|jgi:DNA-binding LacI/PurR family transcriptional regulator|nr:LacI family transcriptional regulator [Bifidobacteriaceae bacterium]